MRLEVTAAENRQLDAERRCEALLSECRNLKEEQLPFWKLKCEKKKIKIKDIAAKVSLGAISHSIDILNLQPYPYPNSLLRVWLLNQIARLCGMMWESGELGKFDGAHANFSLLRRPFLHNSIPDARSRSRLPFLL